MKGSSLAETPSITGGSVPVKFPQCYNTDMLQLSGSESTEVHLQYCFCKKWHYHKQFLSPFHESVFRAVLL